MTYGGLFNKSTALVRPTLNSIDVPGSFDMSRNLEVVGSVVFPNGTYIFNKEKKINSDTKYDLREMYGPLYALLMGREELARSFLGEVFSNLAAGSLDGAYMDELYGKEQSNTFRAEYASKVTAFVKGRSEERLRAIRNHGYTLLDFLIVDGYIDPIEGRHDFPISFDGRRDSDTFLLRNVADISAKILGIELSSQERVRGSEIIDDENVPSALKSGLQGYSNVIVRFGSGGNLSLVHQITDEANHFYAQGGDFSLSVNVDRSGRFASNVVYQLPNPDVIPRELFRLMDNWNAAYDKSPEKKLINIKLGEGYVVNLCADPTQHKFSYAHCFRSTFSLVKLFLDVLKIAGNSQKVDNRSLLTTRRELVEP